jgi:hypothetical protein
MSSGPMFENDQQMSKKNIEAMTKSFDVVSKSAQAIATEMADYSKKSFEHGQKAFNELTTIKSPDKVLEVQTAYSKAVCESLTAHVTKLAELHADLAKVALKPYEGVFSQGMASHAKPRN